MPTRWQRAVCVLILVISVLAFVASVARAQDATTTPASPLDSAGATDAGELGSVAQLSLRRPLLGFDLIDLSQSPSFYEQLTLGGGDLFVDLGGDCASGYTGNLASVGLVTTQATGPIQVGF